MKERSSGVAWLAAIMLLMVALPAAYISGYFLRCQVLEGDNIAVFRLYPSRWEANLFKPAAYIESALTDRNVAATNWEKADGAE